MDSFIPIRFMELEVIYFRYFCSMLNLNIFCIINDRYFENLSYKFSIKIMNYALLYVNEKCVLLATFIHWNEQFYHEIWWCQPPSRAILTYVVNYAVNWVMLKANYLIAWHSTSSYLSLTFYILYIL